MHIVHFIVKEIWQALLTSIRATRAKLTLIVDESTSLSKKSCLIVYLRTSVNSSEPLTFFLDLIELESTTADGISSTLINCLQKHGLDDAFLKECLVGFFSDGASVMVRKTEKYVPRTYWLALSKPVIFNPVPRDPLLCTFCMSPLSDTLI